MNFYALNSHVKFSSNKVEVACYLHLSRKIQKRDRNCHLCIKKPNDFFAWNLGQISTRKFFKDYKFHSKSFDYLY